MSDKYTISKVSEKSDDELKIVFRVKTGKAPPFESSIDVPHHASEETVLKWINNTAYNQIEHRVKKKEKEDKDKADKEKAKNNRDKLKKDIDKLKDIDVNITEPDND